jgi:hypothetical protein
MLMKMEIKDQLKKEIADMLSEDESTEEYVKRLKLAGLDELTRIMMGRHCINSRAAEQMVVECMTLRRNYLISFFSGKISRGEWLQKKEEVDDYVVRKYTGMLH